MTCATAANLETCAQGKCAQPAEAIQKHGLVDEDGVIFDIVEIGYCLPCFNKLGDE